MESTTMSKGKWTANAKVAERYDITPMCVWRWDQAEDLKALGWPPSVVIRGRKYKETALLDKFDENVHRASVRELKTRGQRRPRKAA
jgi:hypothetical protein